MFPAHMLILSMLLQPQSEVLVDTACNPGKVREKREFVKVGAIYHGTVVDIDKNEISMSYIDRRSGKQLEGTFPVIDLLTRGEYPSTATGAFAYRLQDVQQGDTVEIHVEKDLTEGKQYCYEICIYRRPGKPLPESQLANKDRRYQSSKVLNEIENSNDVSDEEISVAFPMIRDKLTNAVVVVGGLPPAYLKKLTTIREKIAAEKAKKEAELKATPPEKKK
jgi:hypothetical protein